MILETDTIAKSCKFYSPLTTFDSNYFWFLFFCLFVSLQWDNVPFTPYPMHIYLVSKIIVYATEDIVSIII